MHSIFTPQLMAMFTMATALRSASGFMGHIRATARRSVAGGRCWMSTSPGTALKLAHQPRISAVPVLDAQAAELKAERLWGMPEARKPVLKERQDEMVKNIAVAGSSAIRSLFATASGERQVDDFVEEAEEISALRRYQYTESLAENGYSGDYDGEDDGNEYYI